MATNVNNLPEKANEIWEIDFVPGVSQIIPDRLVISIPDIMKVSNFRLQDSLESKIIGVGSVESSFLVQCSRGIDNFDDEDLAPLLVFMECLTALEVFN